MKRSIDGAFDALRQQVTAWARNEEKPGLRIFVYPPEWEPLVLARFPAFEDECEAAGQPLSLVDVGQGFLAELERRPALLTALEKLEWERPDDLLHDLGIIAGRNVRQAISQPVEPPSVCRLLINTGSLGTLVSYSAITNELGVESDLTGGTTRSVLAFPGEDDERSLSLLRLRADTNYRVPRI